MNKPTEASLLAPAADTQARVLAQWQKEYAQQIGTDRAVFNRSGLPIKPLYTARDWSQDPATDQAGLPGQAPYTRGIYATMHRGRTWT